jgi:two-component system chemotaxis response regulator CheB
MAIRVLVVDDSAFMRKIISDMLNDISGVQVVATARDGRTALEIISRQALDIITLDVEMPGMDGLETLKRIKESSKVPVMMLSSNNKPETTIEALELGALDFVEKPVDIRTNIREIQIELEEKIKSLVIQKVEPNQVENNPPRAQRTSGLRKFEALVIGASTGGPKALVHLVSRLPGSIGIPVFIVQHMPKGFTASLADRMDKESPVKVVEAKDNMPILPGRVYLAPGDYHMILTKGRVKLDEGEKIHGVRPAVDHLFNSASDIYGEGLLGVILTGMGKDGAEGMVKIKENGGYNIVQNKETCTVYGMPGSAVAKGVVDQILSLDDISQAINGMVG